MQIDWLALYQFANVSLETIAELAGYRDKTTISKGMHQAAKLAPLPHSRKVQQVEIALGGAFSTDLIGVYIHPESGQSARTRDADSEHPRSQKRERSDSN